MATQATWVDEIVDSYYDGSAEKEGFTQYRSLSSHILRQAEAVYFRVLSKPPSGPSHPFDPWKSDSCLKADQIGPTRRLYGNSLVLCISL